MLGFYRVIVPLKKFSASGERVALRQSAAHLIWLKRDGRALLIMKANQKYLWVLRPLRRHKLLLPN